MGNSIRQISDDIADVVASASNSVVRVAGRRRLPASGVIWSADGIIVTANHVIERDSNIRVGLPGGDVSDAQLVGRDPTTDVALIRVAASDLTPPDWSQPASARVGNLVVAVGRPSDSTAATFGIISAKGNPWRLSSNESYIQTDVSMYPGFSGGPLVDASSQFLGINTSALFSGIPTTIAKPTLDRVAAQLLQHGRIRRGYLGIGSQPAVLPGRAAQSVGQERGLLIVSVEPDSPADNGGLLIGDVIVSVGGSAVHGIDSLFSALGSESVGRATHVRVVRGGVPADLTITIGERA